MPLSKVLIDQIKDIGRASEWASKCDEAPVWSELAHAQLASGMVAEAIASYLKANDSSRCACGFLPGLQDATRQSLPKNLFSSVACIANEPLCICMRYSCA